MMNQDGRPNKKKPVSPPGKKKALAAAWLQHSQVPTIGIDPSEKIVYLNDAALADFGFDREATTGVSFFSLFTDESADKVNEQLLKKGQPIKDKVFIVKIGGEQKWALISSGVAPDNKEDTVMYLFIRDITRFRKRESLFAYLNQAATALAKTRDTATALKQIAEFIVPSFANWFTVDLIKDGKLELILLKHEDPAKVKWAYQYRKNYPADLDSNTGAAAVIKSGKPGFLSVVTEEMIDLTITDPIQCEEVKKIGLHSVIITPMWTDDKVSGLVNFISSRPDHHFDEEDLDFALNFANLISLALENTRLNEEAGRELALRKEGEEKFRFLLDAIPHKVWTSGADGRATYYNKRWYDYTGIQGFENLREKVWGFIHADHMAEVTQRWRQAVNNGEDVEIEHRLRRHDGTHRWHLSRFSIFKGNEDRPAIWIGTSTDIHEQKVYEIELASANEEISASNEELAAANEELEAANEEQVAINEELMEAQDSLQRTIKDLEVSKMRFKSILDSIPQIAWASNAKGEVEYYNKRWYDYTGLTFEETGAWNWQRVIHPEDLPRHLEGLSAIIESRKPGEFETRKKSIDGAYRWHLVRMLPLFGSSGRLEQWIGTATDIDELKKIQQQKDDFISIASHELKTPLTSLKMSIQLLYRMKDKVLIEKFCGLLEQANRSMYRMSILVDNLLNVNRIREERLPLQKQWFTLSELVNACCNHIAITGRHEIDITGNKMLKIFADEAAIDQVIVNLVNNAVKYASQSKTIQIIIEETGNNAMLSVKDNGPGISPDDLPLIFNRYYQVGQQHYGNPGMGLGLYISSEIIKKHGGDMGVESELGKGSTFWFTVPSVQ